MWLKRGKLLWFYPQPNWGINTMLSMEGLILDLKLWTWGYDIENDFSECQRIMRPPFATAWEEKLHEYLWQGSSVKKIWASVCIAPGGEKGRRAVRKQEENKSWRLILSDSISWWGTDQWDLLNILNKEWLKRTVAAVPRHTQMTQIALHFSCLILEVFKLKPIQVFDLTKKLMSSWASISW